MSKRFTRRQILGSSLLLGAGLGLGAAGSAQGRSLALTPTPTPEGDAPMLELTGAITGVHDPSIIKAEDTYYIFCTGNGIPVRKSTDLAHWSPAFPAIVMIGVPDWAREKIPGQNDSWAPDISYYNDRYHLYYSVSTFGSNRSVIGLLTNATLDSEDDAFEWVDEGLVVESVSTDNYNCIDPNLVLDEDGVPWLAFGSFWSGIKMRRLDAITGKPSDDDPTLYSLARRTVNSGSVEAPFIIRRGGFYYLFVSFDFCCRGVESTYHVAVGRSTVVTGPYVDRDGTDMIDGGGTQVTFPTDRWRGPGHNAILQEDGVEYIVYHAYDAEYQGTPTLRIAPLTWDANGWPSLRDDV
ncbi:MAG TPA: arabinan endo-1,5-alpha-L-arabinosidase [Aggregatilinea sp.]|uniref:arabinan endo-1,5-alpha-L-arabinosidase n=1 Tax=Aggregatilinea sp. TaxID=2806333 RepID=UPI002B8A7464|nr:arabinan endo-1,5-alpha-L-arabinosidase [Aggregatilinea sp.]HML22021.1 arabinan endo-1,5-alpha-L-arabinosidase [Aggregatilinea sp.]